MNLLKSGCEIRYLVYQMFIFIIPNQEDSVNGNVTFFLPMRNKIYDRPYFTRNRGFIRRGKPGCRSPAK